MEKQCIDCLFEEKGWCYHAEIRKKYEEKDRVLIGTTDDEFMNGGCSNCQKRMNLKEMTFLDDINNKGTEVWI